MFLLRHASAGVRLSSPSIDRFRRLDEAGRIVARQLIWTLADHEITRIVSSPLPRCVESVIPLAESRALTVESRWELAPDVPIEQAATPVIFWSWSVRRTNLGRAHFCAGAGSWYRDAEEHRRSRRG